MNGRLRNRLGVGFVTVRLLLLAWCFAPVGEAAFNYTLIPADKKLDPAWVASLYARGAPTVVTGAALDRIGMPVGGIFCGQLYLAGDGRLWNWDLFNSPSTSYSEMMSNGDGDHYVFPRACTNSPVNQGFALKVTQGGTTQYRKLDRTGFTSTAFTGQYPIGLVNYSDPGCPVAVTLEAFSPFLPLNADDSGIPATIMEYAITNRSGVSVDVEIAGWLQNMVCHFSQNIAGLLRNRTVIAGDRVEIVGSAECYPTNAPGTFAPDVAPDYGTMSLALLNPTPNDRVGTRTAIGSLTNLFDNLALNVSADATNDVSVQLVGGLGRPCTLAPGAVTTVTYVVAWYFPKTTNNNAIVNGNGWTRIRDISTLQKYGSARV